MLNKISFLLILFTLTTLNIHAQDNGEKGKVLLDEVARKYGSYKTIVANFKFRVTFSDKSTYEDGGWLRTEQGSNKYKIRTNAQEIISDGKNVWSMELEDKTVQISKADNSTNSISPSNIFSFYKSGFKPALMKDEKVADEVMKVVLLSPTDKSTNYATIRIRINKNKHIHDVLVSDKNGGVLNYTITSLYVNSTIQPGNFVFSTANYPGFEIVDIR